MATDYTVLSDICGGIATALATALEVTPNGRPDKVITPHMPVYDDCCDFIGCSVARGDATTAETWPDPVGRHTPQCFEWLYVETLQVSLRRPCKPILTPDKNNPFPSDARITVHGQELMIDYMVLRCDGPPLVESIVNGRQDLAFLNGENRILPGPITPHSAGDCAGWNWQFRVEIGCNCDDV